MSVILDRAAAATMPATAKLSLAKTSEVRQAAVGRRESGLHYSTAVDIGGIVTLDLPIEVEQAKERMLRAQGALESFPPRKFP